MPTIAQLKSDGLACFTHVESGAKLTASPAIGVMQNISDALSDKDFVGSKLHELEKELSDELCRRLPQQPNRVENFNAMYPVRHETVRTAPTPEYRGLFSTVMRKMEIANGFGELSYAWGVSAAAFLTNLKARRPFKDYSASPNYHGEHTHRVQWWLLCKFVLPESGTNARYYEECAYWTCRLTGTPDGKERTLYLWDYLFDSASNTTGFLPTESVGRNPNNVYTLCRNPEYPLLSQFMRYRRLKTLMQQVTVGDIRTNHVASLVEVLQELSLPTAILERAAQRFEGKGFATLDKDRQTQLVSKILALGFTDHALQE